MSSIKLINEMINRKYLNYLKFKFENILLQQNEKNHIFDKCIELILKQKKQVYNYHINNGIPTIYYLGMNKTGSTSLKKGFNNDCTAKWYKTKRFELLFNTTLLSDNNYNLFDLIIYISKRFNFKPLIIESVREPISKSISETFQHLAHERPGCKCDLCNYKNNKENKFSIKSETNNQLIHKLVINKIKPININKVETYELMMKYFNFDITKNFNKQKKFLLKDFDNIKYLLIRFEEIKNRSDFFKSIGYAFTNNHSNKTTPNKINISLSKEKIASFYNEYTKIFYTYDEFHKLTSKYKV